MAKVLGLDGLKRKVTKLRKDIQPGVQDGLWKAGDIIIAEQENLVPIDEGDLARSLERKLVRGQESGNQAVQVSTDDFKARWIEFGTKRKDQGGRAQPFFFPGFRAARKRARAVINKAVRDSVKKAVK